MVGVSAKKFAQRAHNTPHLVFLGLLGEFFRGWAAGGGLLGESCRANRQYARCRAVVCLKVRWPREVLQLTSLGDMPLALWGSSSG